METPMIYGAIIDAMGKISAIGKDRKNQTQGFAYRGIDDVMNELHSTLAECGIFVVPEVLEENRETGTTSRGGTLFYTRLKIKFTFYAKDGSSVNAVVIGEAMDSGDKASNKALSIGLKYALLQVFCIPTEEEKDPDATIPDYKPNPNVPPIVSVNKDYATLKKIVETYEEQLSGKPYELSCEALAENDPAKIAEMIERCKAYLQKKGIVV